MPSRPPAAPSSPRGRGSLPRLARHVVALVALLVTLSPPAGSWAKTAAPAAAQVTTHGAAPATPSARQGDRQAAPRSAMPALQVRVALHGLEERRRAPLSRIVRRALRDVERTLGAKLDGQLRVDFAGSDDDFAQLVRDAGARGQFAEPWVAGLALLHADRVLIRMDGPGILYTSEVVRHELAHVAVHALAKGRPLPRWFHEGVAMVVAGEATLDRLQQGLGAGGFGEFDTLDGVNAAFRGHRLKVQRAYAVSAGFVRFAVRRSGDRRSLANLHRRMALGLDFSPAFTATFGLAPRDLYGLYARYLDSASSRWSLFASDALVWGFISVLSVVSMGLGWWRRPRFEGEPMDLEAIAAAGAAAMAQPAMWLRDDVLTTDAPPVDTDAAPVDVDAQERAAPDRDHAAAAPLSIDFDGEH